MTMVPDGNSIFRGMAFTATVCCLVVPLASLTVMTALPADFAVSVYFLSPILVTEIWLPDTVTVKGPAPPTSVSVPVEPTVSADGAASVSVGRFRTISDSSRVAPALSLATIPTTPAWRPVTAYCPAACCWMVTALGLLAVTV